MKHFSISSKNGEKISNNLIVECAACFDSCTTKGIKIDSCPKYGDQRRQGIISNNTGTTFLCCDETKTTKLFREKLEALSYAYYDLIIPKQQYEKEAKLLEQQRVNRLVHNLTSINAHNIQEIYDLVPQALLTSDYQKQLDFIQAELKKNTRKAALMFLRIAKHNIHMKSEFSIYKKLDRDDAVLEFRNHPIQKVLMNVLHTFFTDFTNKGIYVEVGEFFGKVSIDYESIQVALYHLIENASKYTMPETNIKIEFIDFGATIDVIFEMRSLYISPEEVDKIFTEGYSGKTAKESKLNGDGIGMWQINQMMILNHGTVRVIAGDDIFKVNEKTYSINKFILSFQKQHFHN